MSAAPVWIDGRICNGDEARVSLADRGFLLGHGAFETLRVTGGAVRRWPAHRKRLEGGLAYLGLTAPALLDEVPRATRELADAAGVQDGVARLTVTAGAGGPGLEARTHAAPTCVLTVKPRPVPPSAVSVAIVAGARRSGSPGEAFKLSGYADLIAARLSAKAGGAERAVVTGPGGALACADCANLYWIKGSRVFTPALETGALSGVTRTALLSAAALHGLEIEAVRAGPQALLEAEAGFMTNAVEGVVAISAVDGVRKDAGHALIARFSRLEAQA